MVSGKLAEPLDALQTDGFDWVHLVTGARARGPLLVDDGSGTALAEIHRAAPAGGNAANTTADETSKFFANDWRRHFGKPPRVCPDPEGNYRPRDLRGRAAKVSIIWGPEPAEAHWQTGRVEARVGIIEEAATRTAHLGPTCPARGLFHRATGAHDEINDCAGVSPDTTVAGRAPRPLDSEQQGTAHQLEAGARSGSPAEVRMWRRMPARQPCAGARAYKKSRLARLARSRAHQIYRRGELVFARRGAWDQGPR